MLTDWQYNPFINLGETGIIVAQKQNEEAELGLSALIHALHELESYAVARYVQKDDAQPQILLLKPNPAVEDEFECLYDVPLPFAEDVRSYQFPPLDKVLTFTGSVIKEHRLLPSADLKQAMSDFVDAMDLSGFDVDDEGYAAATELPEAFTILTSHQQTYTICPYRRDVQPNHPPHEPGHPRPSRGSGRANPAASRDSLALLQAPGEAHQEGEVGDRRAR